MERLSQSVLDECVLINTELKKCLVPILQSMREIKNADPYFKTDLDLDFVLRQIPELFSSSTPEKEQEEYLVWFRDGMADVLYHLNHFFWNTKKFIDAPQSENPMTLDTLRKLNKLGKEIEQTFDSIIQITS